MDNHYLQKQNTINSLKEQIKELEEFNALPNTRADKKRNQMIKKLKRMLSNVDKLYS